MTNFYVVNDDQGIYDIASASSPREAIEKYAARTIGCVSADYLLRVGFTVHSAQDFGVLLQAASNQSNEETK